MANINSILQNAEQGIVHLAQQTLSTYSKQAISDGQDFLAAIKSDLTSFVEQLEDGDIDQTTFKTLVQNDANLAQMNALKQVGLAQAALDSFVNGAISIIITAAFSAIP
jgi:hypothetical protein